MAKLFADKSGSYVVVDFDNVTEKGLKNLITSLNRNKAKVINVEATNRKMRKDGLFVKKVKFFFENGQTMTLFIGSEGDIYQMTLNATKQPLPNSTSESALAKAMAQMMGRNQAKFDKSALKKAAKVQSPAQGKTAGGRSMKAKADEANQRLTTLNQNHKDMTTILSDKRGQLSESEGNVSKLQQQLETEKQETAQLEQQLAYAKNGANN